MKYISTRNNHPPVSPSEAIMLGMVPGGGLFVPEEIPKLPEGWDTAKTYQETARLVLTPFLSDFSAGEIDDCVAGAYNSMSFDTDGIVDMVELDGGRSILELWHGPTAAFKDVALQIMPLFMQYAKAKTGDTTHTVILVATSGDTGKAALEGFRDRPGVSIIVFYPHEGVSEIQRLQMVTTGGKNTHVIGVQGNFDDCQTGVKAIFSDVNFGALLGGQGQTLSSANSINWGRLCPQIAYYVHSYNLCVNRGFVRQGDPVNFCVPTGNFGNLLAAWYAKRMGLPIGRLVCASNTNRVLADFFASGSYDRRREFFRTASPSMDILISSNLERFLFELTGRDAGRVARWFGDLMAGGCFTIDAATKTVMNTGIAAGWADDEKAFAAIGRAFSSTGYILDTHTAVAVAVDESLPGNGSHTVIDATASPYKFSSDVYEALTGNRIDDEFECINRIHALSRRPIHRGLVGLREKTVNHDRIITLDRMSETVAEICGAIARGRYL